MELKSYSGLTHQGPCLQVNEDIFEVDLINGLFMVFDGFGGSGIGDKVVHKLKDNIKLFYSRVVADPESTMPFYFSKKYLIEGNSLINALHYSHKLLCKENCALEMSSRGGASGIVAALSETLLTISSTGNCQSYLLRRGELEKIIVEDSHRLLTPMGAEGHFNTAPLSGFGLFDELHVQTRELRIEDRDLIVFLSDGAYSRVTDHELKYILGESEGNLNEKIGNIFSLANSRGNLDNQTVLLLQF